MSSNNRGDDFPFGINAGMHRHADIRAFARALCGSAIQAKGPGHVVDGLHAVESCLQTIRKRIISEIHICKQRVAANCGHVERMEDRSQSGLIVEGNVRVPTATEICGIVVLGFFLDRQNLGLL